MKVLQSENTYNKKLTQQIYDIIYIYIYIVFCNTYFTDDGADYDVKKSVCDVLYVTPLDTKECVISYPFSTKPAFRSSNNKALETSCCWSLCGSFGKQRNKIGMSI